jgi:hypothetical protein
VITYTVPAGHAVPFSLKLNGLPKGNYLAMISVVMHGTTTSVCFLDDGTDPIDLLGYGAAVSFGYSTVNASGLVSVRAGHPLTLECNSATDVAAANDSHSQVSFTPVGKVALKTGTVTRSAPHRSGAGH